MTSSSVTTVAASNGPRTLLLLGGGQFSNNKKRIGTGGTPGKEGTSPGPSTSTRTPTRFIGLQVPTRRRAATSRHHRATCICEASPSSSPRPRGVEDLNLDIEAPGWSGGYGTGGKVWSSSAVLCRWLIENASALRIEGASVLELGAGTGVVGIAAAALGASRVVLTDGGSSSLLRLAKDNAARNMREEDGPIDKAATTVTVVGYSWGRADLPPEMTTAAPYDLVIGSDCTYSVSGHGALCDSILAILSLSESEKEKEKEKKAESTSESVSREKGRGGGVTRVILGHQHRTLAAALAGRGSAGWGRDPHLGMFVETAAKRGLIVTELFTESLAWHGLRNVSVLKVELCTS